MTPSDWEEIRDIAVFALRLAPKDRASYLDEACLGDPERRRKVEAFLTSQASDGTLMDEKFVDDDKPAVDASSTVFESVHKDITYISGSGELVKPDLLTTNPSSDHTLQFGAASLPPAASAHNDPFATQSDSRITNSMSSAAAKLATERFIGHYKVIKEIGEGGMGKLFLAIRDDDVYKKKVAIKLVKRGMDSDYVLSRFRYERQILASLEHPNIARLLDGGTTEDGRPYFVMEYVEGMPIDVYCDAKKLNILERLKLFSKVCSAVHYAHQNLVVHRDIKPNNILVTEEGEPKLLDFGIAKLLAPDLYGDTGMQTSAGMRMMTPYYASPEQVLGKMITTASDTYSLGVLLYELLTGHKPYRLKTIAPHELERIICQQEPERPSTAIEKTEEIEELDGTTSLLRPETISESRSGQPQKLRRRLSGDLDNIVLMALRKEPQRRYTTVEQFSEDIRRHMEGLPVIARPDTLSYRVSKFIWRHKFGVAAAGVIVALLAGFVAMTLVQNARVNRALQKATRERDRAERVSGFLVDLFKVSDPSEARGNEIKAREILDKGAAQIEQGLTDQPEIQATLMNTMGRVYQSLGLYDRATPLMENALKARRQLFGNDNADVATSLNGLGELMFAKNELDDAETMLRESLATRRRLEGEESAGVAECINNLASVLFAKKDYEAAEPMMQKALEMRRKLFGTNNADVAEGLNNLGALTLFIKNDPAGAEPYYREALEIYRNLYGSDHPRIAQLLSNTGLAVAKKGDLQAAEPFFRDALAMRRKLYGAEHPEIAESLHNLGGFFRDKGDFAAAEPFFRDAVAMRRKLLGNNSPAVISSLNNLAFSLYQQGKLTEAEPLYRESLETTKNLQGAESPATATVLFNLASLLYDKGSYQEAATMFRQSLDIRMKKPGKEHQDTGLAMVGEGKSLVALGDAKNAEPLLRDGVDIVRQKLTENNWQTADARSALGGCLTLLKKYDEAGPLLENSYQFMKANRGDKDRRTAQALNRLIAFYQATGQKEKATEYRALLAKN
jgi:serine/threonine-protein kinase